MEKKNNNQETVGYILKNARKNIGLSQEDLANKLCLKLSTIKEIEQDIYSQNICFTFIQGYIKSYANIVNLPQDKIDKLICMIKKNFNTPNLFSLKEEKLSKKINIKYKIWILFSVSIVTLMFILIIFFGIWHWGENIKNIQNDLIKLNQNNSVLEVNSLESNIYKYDKNK